MGRQEGKQDFAGSVSSGNTQIAYTTITPERQLSSVALTFLAAPQFASITYISFNV